MKKTGFISAVVISSMLIISGCAREIEETIYLGDAKIKSPISTPPVHLNINSRPGDITISPKFSFTNNKSMLTTSDEVFPGTITLSDGSVYRPKDKNIEWVYSRFVFGADMDFKISRLFALFGGFSFSNDNYSGANIGAGIFSSSTEPIIRFDFGLSFQSYKYNAITIVDQQITYFWGGESSDRYLFRDDGKNTSSSPFFTLTFNSNNDSAFVSYFVSAGYFMQTLLNFTPQDSYYSNEVFTRVVVDERSDCTAGFLYFNPGVSFKLNTQMRLLINAKLLKESALGLDTGNIIIIPNVQVDFNL
jgi:hypothetical protein